jgi:hypothetical protein
MKTIITLILLSLFFSYSSAQENKIININKINVLQNGLSYLPNGIKFLGRSVCSIGDINKDGNSDLIAGVYNELTLEGNLIILFLDNKKEVLSYNLIGPNTGGFNGSFGNMQYFGTSIDLLGDLNSDGINEIVVGNSGGGGSSKGEIYILFFNQLGNVVNWKNIGSNSLPLNNNDRFGLSIASIGDLNKDGVNDIAVNIPSSDDGGLDKGAIVIIFLNDSGLVKNYQIISDTKGNFNGNINGIYFGLGLGKIGDLNKDGFNDIICSSISNSTASNDTWIIFLDDQGKVKKHQLINKDSGNFIGYPTNYFSIGWRCNGIGDVNGDSILNIIITAPSDSLDNKETGNAWLLLMRENGTIMQQSSLDTNFLLRFILQNLESFGTGLFCYELDINGDYKYDVIISSPNRDDGGTDKGAIYLLSLDGAVHPTTPKALWRVNATSGNQNTVFNFTQYSTGFPSAFKWSITPNTFTYQSGTSDTSANPIIKFNETANYSVQLKVTNTFSSDSLLRSSYINVQKVGVNNAEKNNTSISIFPNPTNGFVQIQSPVNIQTILVFDITGKQLLQQEPNAQTDEINMSSLPPGLY